MDQPKLDDYQYVDRSDGSLKYQRAKLSHPQLDCSKQIVVTTADMDFKFPDHLFNQIFEIYPQTSVYGYNKERPSLVKAFQKWINQRYCPDIQLNTKTNCIFWCGMGPVISAVINSVTQQDDQILVMVPTYYRYLSNIKHFKRKSIQFPLSVVNGRFQIDFQQLEKTFQNHSIKLLLLASPWNPCGRIWSKCQLETLKDLLIKYQVYVLADEIFSDCVEPSEGADIFDVFTSMLRFPDIYPFLIYGVSPSKAMNCSGMPCSITITPNPETYKKMFDHMLRGHFTSVLSFPLVEAIYTDPKANQWRINTIKYLKKNFIKFKQLCADKTPKLKVFDLDCSYLVVIDFQEYRQELNIDRLQEYLKKVSLCALVMSNCFVSQNATSLVRINIAVNEKIIEEIVNRLQQLVNIPWIQ